jgi:hypothetical protein
MVGVYSALTIFGVLFLDSIIFQPPPPGYRDDAPVIKVTSADGAKISAKYFPNPNATYTLLFSHGNAEDIGYDTPLLEVIHNVNQIIAWGRSLGGAAAVDLAPKRPVASLVMESAFTSAFRVLTILPFEQSRLDACLPYACIRAARRGDL